MLAWRHPVCCNAKFSLQENFPSYIVDERKIGFSVFDIIKAGSLGHGTSVEGNYDLDLVVYSSGM